MNCHMGVCAGAACLHSSSEASRELMYSPIATTVHREAAAEADEEGSIKSTLYVSAVRQANCFKYQGGGFGALVQ
jgi:hypothetical protein